MFELFKSKQVDLNIDPLLANKLNYEISGYSGNRNFSFRPIQLVYLLGTFETSRYNSSIVNKLYDFSHLYDYILSNTNQFKVDITEIRTNFGSEKIQQVSEQFGYAFGLLTLNKLLNTQSKNIKKIKGSGNAKRADYEGFSEFNEIIVLESKGSINQQTINQQIARGIAQKNASGGNFGVVTAIKLEEASVSKLHIVDPPSRPRSLSEDEKKLVRVDYYIRVFNFLGIKEFSHYFSLMRRRLSGEPLTEWFSDKLNLLSKIKNSYSKLKYQNDIYFGSYQLDDEGLICFTGIREQALYFNDFLEDSFIQPLNENGSFDQDSRGRFYFPEDKIIIAYLADPAGYIDEYSHDLAVKKTISVNDLHYSNEIVTINLIRQVLKENGAHLEPVDDFPVDIVFSYMNKKYYLEVKKIFSSDKDVLLKIYQNSVKLAEINNLRNFILFTPNSLKNIKNNVSDRVKIMDREVINQLLKNQKRLSDFL